MTTRSIFHLEKYPFFLKRVLELNRLYNPEDPVHAPLELNGDDWHEFASNANGSGPDTPQGRAVIVRKCLYSVHANFPNGSPVHEQMAYLVRAFTGLRLFNEANFRTGWDYAMETAMHNRFEVMASDEDRVELANEVFDQCVEAYGEFLDKKLLLERDDVFNYVADWFHHRVA